MLDVVAFERNTVRDANWPIGNESKVAVVHRLLEEEVVCELVNGEEERLRDGRTEDVRDRNKRRPR